MRCRVGLGARSVGGECRMFCSSGSVVAAESPGVMWVISALCELRELLLVLMVCLKSHVISSISLIEAQSLGTRRLEFYLDDSAEKSGELNLCRKETVMECIMQCFCVSAKTNLLSDWLFG